MPVSNSLTGNVYQMSEPVESSDLIAMVADPKATRLQASTPIKGSTWKRVAEIVVAQRPDIELRVYGYYGEVCDLEFLRHLPDLRQFAGDCLHGTVRNVESIAELTKLESLSIGMWELRSLEFLGSVPAGLRRLSVGASKSKSVDLAPIGRFRELRELFVEGHQKRIEVVSEFSSLERIWLRSISTPGLTYLRPLNHLQEVWLGLGGVRDLKAICGKESITRLELWQVRGLEDVGLIAELPSLRDVWLQSLPHVRSLPDLRNAAELRRVVLTNMKGLTSFGALEFAPALEAFALWEAMKVPPAALAPVLRNPRLRMVSVGLGSDAKNEAFESMRIQAGLVPYKHEMPRVAS